MRFAKAGRPWSSVFQVSCFAPPTRPPPQHCFKKSESTLQVSNPAGSNQSGPLSSELHFQCVCKAAAASFAAAVFPPLEPGAHRRRSSWVPQPHLSSGDTKGFERLCHVTSSPPQFTQACQALTFKSPGSSPCFIITEN